ncbi:hypothetical protein FKM82_025393 [Ascaphus truei]
MHAHNVWGCRACRCACRRAWARPALSREIAEGSDPATAAGAAVEAGKAGLFCVSRAPCGEGMLRLGSEENGDF